MALSTNHPALFYPYHFTRYIVDEPGSLMYLVDYDAILTTGVKETPAPNVPAPFRVSQASGPNVQLGAAQLASNPSVQITAQSPPGLIFTTETTTTTILERSVNIRRQPSVHQSYQELDPTSRRVKGAVKELMQFAIQISGLPIEFQSDMLRLVQPFLTGDHVKPGIEIYGYPTEVWAHGRFHAIAFPKYTFTSFVDWRGQGLLVQVKAVLREICKDLPELRDEYPRLPMSALSDDQIKSKVFVQQVKQEMRGATEWIIGSEDLKEEDRSDEAKRLRRILRKEITGIWNAQALYSEGFIMKCANCDASHNNGECIEMLLRDISD